GQPHLVVPHSNRSRAAAALTSAVALLLDSAPGDSLRSEAVKVLLMAGAARQTSNTGPQELIDAGSEIDIVNYGSNSAGNGLDLTYGAGQLDINASHQLLMAGNQPSTEDDGTGIGMKGYHYDAGFGGASGTNGMARYPFSTGAAPERLAATLAWNVDIEDNAGPFDPTRTLHPLDLELVDVTGGGALLVATSASAIDNTETLYVEIDAWRDYELRVVRSGGASFNWDYALAWNRVELEEDATMVPALPPGWLPGIAAALWCVARRNLLPGPRLRG
ncbi:MAG: hypothetical protein HKO62_09590, partial [Gammaproteobacteria bacterium]|nr:hypothetical protein [Gammaproteobacteria bacterium]